MRCVSANSEAVNRAIDSTIHLRRIAEFGGGSKINSTATDQYVRKPKPVREQPQNLKPRFTPIGVPTPTPAPVSATKAKSASSAAAKSKLVVESKLKSKSESETSSDGDSDEEMADAPALPVSADPGTTINGGLKRKQPVDDDSSDSDSSDSSDSSDNSDSEDEPAKTLKSPEKSTKRPKTVLDDIVKTHDAKKSTPVPTPVMGFSTPGRPAASNTPSKLPGSKTKSDKKAKKVDASKSSEKESKKIKETPIPPPKVGLRG